jgi:cobalamin biosynthetic protein CobC
MPTYNEHAAAFLSQGWSLATTENLRVLVHPNNPTGHFWTREDLNSKATVIDESFCDIAPERSLIDSAREGERVILKSFGKFWGLAGLRLGFMIAQPDLVTKMRDHIGPWAVSGPALEIGTAALSDEAWAESTREQLRKASEHLDDLMLSKGASLVGGCSLFRLYNVGDAAHVQSSLAKHHVWTRIFPYSDTYIRLGLPAPNRWSRLESALDKVTL